MNTRSWKDGCTHLATRCALPVLAIVAVTSISGVGSAQAMHLGGGGFFRPSMPRVSMPRVNAPSGISSVAVGRSSSYGAGAAGYGAKGPGYVSGGKGAGVAGANAWGHNKWFHPKPDQHVVEHTPKNPCGTTTYRRGRIGNGCDTPPSKTATGGNDGGYTPPSGTPPIGHKPGSGVVVVTGPSTINSTTTTSSNVVRSNTGPSNIGPSNTAPSVRLAALPPAGETRYVSNEIVGELSGNASDQAINAFEARHRLNRVDSQRIGLTNSTWVRWRITDRRSVPVVMRAMQTDTTIRTTVVTFQPNFLFTVQQEQGGRQGVTQQAGQDGDSAQYALAKLHLPEAQTLARGNSVVVGVIDTEIDTTHPELAGAVADSYDALGVAGPRETHGTGIAGTIAARAKLLGAAPNVRILAIRAFGSGIGTTFSIIKGLDYAVAHDARVINMSFAGPSDPALSRALGAAHNKGSILIAAVGNKGPKSPALFPAADPSVIAVTATDAKDRLFQGANRGDHVAIAAPGVDILVATPGNTYAMQTGTSFASAYVAGVAALLAERKPDITPDAAKNALMSTAHKLGQKSRDPDFGAGLMDAHQAVLAVGGKPAAELTGR